MIIESSIVKKISIKSLPEDVQIHAYPGSTSSQKLSMIEHYTVRRPLTSLVLQDGTNTLLKISQGDVSELFREFESLVTKSLEKFEPTKIFLREVPPLRTNERNSVNNERITQWNNILHEKYKDEPYFQIIPLN